MGQNVCNSCKIVNNIYRNNYKRLKQLITTVGKEMCIMIGCLFVGDNEETNAKTIVEKLSQKKIVMEDLKDKLDKYNDCSPFYHSHAISKTVIKKFQIFFIYQFINKIFFYFLNKIENDEITRFG